MHVSRLASFVGRRPLASLVAFAIVTMGVVGHSSAPSQDPPQSQAAPQTPQARPPVFRGGVNFVVVDAYPQKDGRIVEGLTAADFQVLEDGKPQTIDQFEFVRIEPAQMPETAKRDPNNAAEMNAWAADPHNRVFVTFLDTLHTTVDGSHSIRQPLIDMLNRVVGPDDLFGVMTQNMRPKDLTLGRRMLSIEEQLTKYWYWGQRQGLGTDPADAAEKDLNVCFHARLTANGWVDWIVDDGPIRRFLDEILIERRREDRVLTSLEDLVAHLGQVREARTVVIAVTDGWLLFPKDSALQNEPGRDLRSGGLGLVPRVGEQPLGTTRQGYADVGWSTCVSELVRLVDKDNDARYRQLFASANRSNVSIYPVTARGLQVWDGGGAADKPPMLNPNPPSSEMTVLGRDQRRLSTRITNLRTLAENTDGIAIVQTNDLAGGLRRIVDDVSAYYLLGYYSTNAKADGKLRRIDVKLKPPGLTVHARRSYFAPSDKPVAGRPGGPAVAAVAAAAVPPAATPVDVALGVLARRKDTAEVFLYGTASAREISVAVELASTQIERGLWPKGADVQVDARQADGTRLGVIAARIEAGARGVLVRVPTNGVAGPWHVSARVTGGEAPIDERIEVTADAGALVGEPILFRALPSPRAPLRPVADLRFRRTERAHVEWPVLAPLDQRTARLLDRRGQPLAVGVTLTERDADGTPVVAVDLNLAPLSEGDYVLELLAGRGAATERKLVAFRVVR